MQFLPNDIMSIIMIFNSDEYKIWPTMKVTVKLYIKITLGNNNVVLIHRWSLYADSIPWKVYMWGPVKYGL